MQFGVLTFVTGRIGPAELGAASSGLSRCSSPGTPIFPSARRPLPGRWPNSEKYYTAPWVLCGVGGRGYHPVTPGTGIALIPERDPIVTAKVASLDLVSQGRFRFGVGGLVARRVANHGVDLRCADV